MEHLQTQLIDNHFHAKDYIKARSLNLAIVCIAVNKVR